MKVRVKTSFLKSHISDKQKTHHKTSILKLIKKQYMPFETKQTQNAKCG